MPLDLHSVSAQVHAMGDDLRAHSAGRLDLLEKAVELFKASGSATRFSPASPPNDYRALATDGSHIDVDRHMPVPCALINISKVMLQYGSAPGVRLGSQPRLYATAEELSVGTQADQESQPLTGALMGLRRTVEEVTALAELAEEHADTLLTLGLIDGSLILWSPEFHSYPEHVRRSLLDDGFLPALDRLKAVAERKRLTVAAYISMPRSTTVVNMLPLQEHTQGDYRWMVDRDVFERTLAVGERSGTFPSTSAYVREHYREHATHFYYLKTEQEMARVEVPAWVAEDEALLALTHSLLLDQCRKGLGYPVAIMEAHEQAVIGGHERELFRQMVEEALARQGLDVYTSEKARSKRLRWV
ncbi:MAG: DNA double-strand break repair nuclease NurA [Dehalococcoidia bacterium]|nr:DNA double-strand break repair nuclease NurA [Dehalococcoidia bacterium]